MPLLQTIGAAAQIGTSLFNIFQGGKMLKEAKKIKPDYFGIDDPRLKGMESQYAKDMLGDAQMRRNARNPFAASQTRAIQGAQANAQAALQRGSVDPVMAMQSILASQAQADRSITDQFAQEQQMQAQRDANLMNAQGVMISERDKALQEKNMKYQMDMSQKNALRSAGQQTISSAGSSLANTFMGLGAQKQQADYNNKYLSMMQKMYGG